MTSKGKLIFIGLTIWGLVVIIGILIDLKRHPFLPQYQLTGILPSVYKMTYEDSNLISKKYWEKAIVYEIYQYKGRGPISHFVFDKDYRLAIYKIDLTSDNQIKNLLRVKSEAADLTTGVTYRVTGINSFYLLCKGGIVSPVPQVYLTLGGDSISTVIENDSVVSYHLRCHDFSIKYALNEPVDLIFQAKKNADDLDYNPPYMDVLFLKRKKALYLLLMAPITAKKPIDPKLLNSIITGE